MVKEEVNKEKVSKQSQGLKKGVVIFVLLIAFIVAMGIYMMQRSQVLFNQYNKVLSASLITHLS